MHLGLEAGEMPLKCKKLKRSALVCTGRVNYWQAHLWS